MVTLMSQHQSEFDLHLRAILGLHVDPGFLGPTASAVIRAGEIGWAPQYTGLEEALAVPASDLRLFGKPQAVKLRRLGVALASGKTVDEARARASLVASRVRVFPHAR
jgi:phosphoribosylglycinamide formyltransferase 2